MSPCGRNSHTIQVEPTAPVHARHWLAGPPSPRECQGGPPTLELGNVSLKKVGSQERRMKKEHADDSWEEMAALRDRRQARGLHALGCTRGPCEHCPPPPPGPEGVELRSQGWTHARVGSGGIYAREHPRSARLHPILPHPSPAITPWSQDTGSPDGGLSEKLSPGNFGVPGHRQALRQDAQGQDEI